MRCLPNTRRNVKQSLMSEETRWWHGTDAAENTALFSSPSVMLVIPKVLNHYRIPYEYTILNSVRLETSQNGMKKKIPIKRVGGFLS